MRLPLEKPVVLRRVELRGPARRHQVDLILDTGAAYTIISWEVARFLGCDPAISRRRISLITANGVIEVPLVKLKSLGIGGITVKDIEVACHDIPELTGVDGLLGLNALDRLNLKLNFRDGYMEIE